MLSAHPADAPPAGTLASYRYVSGPPGPERAIGWLRVLAHCVSTTARVAGARAPAGARVIVDRAVPAGVCAARRNELGGNQPKSNTETVRRAASDPPRIDSKTHYIRISTARP